MAAILSATSFCPKSSISCLPKCSSRIRLFIFEGLKLPSLSKMSAFSSKNFLLSSSGLASLSYILLKTNSLYTALVNAVSARLISKFGSMFLLSKDSITESTNEVFLPSNSSFSSASASISESSSVTFGTLTLSIPLK